MASGYYIHRNLLTEQQQETFKNYFDYDYNTSSNIYNGIALENLFETNNYTTSSLNTLSKYTSKTDTFKYIPSSLSPEWSSTLTLTDYFGPSLSGVLRGESPTFGKCLLDSDNHIGYRTFYFNLAADRKSILVSVYNETYDTIQGLMRFEESDFPGNFIPNKLLFVLQGAGGGGGGGAELGNLFAGGSGGGSGGLAAAIVDLSQGEVTVQLGKGGTGSAEGSKTNGADGEPSVIGQGLYSCIITGGQGGGYARSVNISADPRAGGGAGGEVVNEGMTIITSHRGAKGGDRGGTSASEDGAAFGISQIILSPTTLNNRTLNATGGAGGASPRYAGGGAGSFFGNGGAGGKDNAGASGNPGGNGTYGAGGGGGGDNATDNKYGKGGNGGDAVLKIYY